MLKNKIAIILWLYHTELAEEFIDLLAPHSKYIDIFLGLCKAHHNNEAADLFRYVFKDNLHIEYMSNGGTDILPTLKLIEKCIDNYSIFFKLHSKKSSWGSLKHVNWRVILLNDILYRDNFYNTIDQLYRSKVGMVGSKPFIMKNNEYTNKEHIIELLSLFNINKEFKYKNFVGGNIFAAKTHIFKPLLYNSIVYNKLSQEIGAIKDDNGGTYVHSMERIFGYMAEYNECLISGSPHHTKIILNYRVKNHRLHLVKLYNNDCYIQENPNIYGNIINDCPNSMDIIWKNRPDHQICLYKKLDKYFINTT